VRLRRFPSQQATIARLPHYSSTPLLQHSITLILLLGFGYGL
jgi:hypothetical protein